VQEEHAEVGPRSPKVEVDSTLWKGGKADLSERTFVMLKPETLMRSLVGEVLSRIENRGLKIIALKIVQLSQENANRLYEAHQGKPFYDPLIEHVTSGPVVVMVLEGPNAISVVRGMIGATDPCKASLGTIRGDLALVTGKNIIHAADSLESAKREMDIFFSENGLVKYEKPVDRGFLL